jgi:DNA-directed RNA polymerase specialized sigma subunit
MSALDDLKQKVDASPRRRERVDQLKSELRRELALEELRKDRGVSQEQLADALGVSQVRISRLGRQSDAQLSTLRAYIEALGGELELAAVFGEERVPLRIE